MWGCCRRPFSMDGTQKILKRWRHGKNAEGQPGFVCACGHSSSSCNYTAQSLTCFIFSTHRFLVDSHKASYVPVCIAGTRTNEILTAEPAVVVPTLQEAELENFSPVHMQPARPSISQLPGRSETSVQGSFRRSVGQYGATLRRASMVSPTSVEGFMKTINFNFSSDDGGSYSFEDSFAESDKQK